MKPTNRTITIIDQTGREWNFTNIQLRLRDNALEVHTSGATYIFIISNLICYYFTDITKENKDERNSTDQTGYDPARN